MPSTKLVHALIAKSLAETLLVGGLAVFAFMTILPPYFHGWSEVRDNAIAGWAVNNASPWERIEVQLYVDGAFTSAAVANLPRTDVRDSGWAKDEWHGYLFSLPALRSGSHRAEVYAIHDSGLGRRKSLQRLGDPIPFLVDSDGRTRKF